MNKFDEVKTQLRIEQLQAYIKPVTNFVGYEIEETENPHTFKIGFWTITDLSLVKPNEERFEGKTKGYVVYEWLGDSGKPDSFGCDEVSWCWYSLILTTVVTEMLQRIVAYDYRNLIQYQIENSLIDDLG